MSEFPRISKRIGAIAESATLKVDAKAKSLQAAGRPVISYAAGEPDFATPAHIVEAALAAVKDPKNHRYTPAIGLPDLREAIAAKVNDDHASVVGIPDTLDLVLLGVTADIKLGGRKSRIIQAVHDAFIFRQSHVFRLCFFQTTDEVIPVYAFRDVVHDESPLV